MTVLGCTFWSEAHTSIVNTFTHTPCSMSMQLPAHLYGELSRTRMGCVLLCESGCLETHISVVEAASSATDPLTLSELVAAKTSLWALVC